MYANNTLCIEKPAAFLKPGIREWWCLFEQIVSMTIGKYCLHQLIYVVCPIIYKLFTYSRGLHSRIPSINIRFASLGVCYPVKRSKKHWLVASGWLGANLQDQEVKVQDPMGQVLSSNLVFVVKQAAWRVFLGTMEVQSEEVKKPG